MDVTLDFEDSLNKTNTSKIDTTQELDSDQEQDKVDHPSNVSDVAREESRSSSEDSGHGDNGEGEEKADDVKKKSDKKQNGSSENEKAKSADKETTVKKKEGLKVKKAGEEKMEVTEELDTIELTSNQFENDLLGAAKPSRKEKPVAIQEAKQEEKPKPKPKQKPKPAPKKAAPPPKIRDRTFTEPEEQPERPKIQWECNLVRNLITTGLLKDLVDVKLNKEEENVEANLARGRRSRPLRTSSSELKKKVVRKEDEDLDFEPESEHDSESEEERDAARDPTAFPSPPAHPVPRSKKDQNRALLITNLIRPFTVLQLKTMLSHCGKVKSIWINTIKSRCYVVFATVEEATRARQSLHGAVWPLTSPKTLNVDYAEDERMYSETDGELIGDSIDIQVIEEQKRKKPRKEKGEKKDSKKNLLDDFFKKTVAVPSIYWLPLGEKEAKARAELRAKGKPRYFVPEPELQSEYVKPRAIPRWRTPERAGPPGRRSPDRRRDERRRR